MAKAKKVVHLGIPYSKKNPVKIPLCMLEAGGVRAMCGSGLGADFETVEVNGLDKVTCKKCRGNLLRRLMGTKGGGL
jgi:hypothetical protein